MCKTKNIIIEIIEGAENKRTFVMREISPNQTAVTLGVFDSGDEVAQFLDAIEIK